MLTARARANRLNPTPAEAKLWREVLQNGRLDGLKFTRQKPLDEYIVDFYCSELMLAIEIDGDSHADQADYDAQRTARLGRLGILVVRYLNRDVLRNIDGVQADVAGHVRRRRKRLMP